MPRLCYCGQINLVRNRDFVVNTCFLLVKQAVALVSFPAWVQRAALVLCLGGHVISLETAAWRHGESSSLICGRRVLCWDGPRVMLLVLWCYGVYKVFDSTSLSQPVLRRESSGPSGSSLRALESELREQEERESCTLARCFKQSDLATAHRRLVESECPYGAEPRPCPWFLIISACVIWYFIHSVKDIHRPLSVVNIHYDAKV